MAKGFNYARLDDDEDKYLSAIAGSKLSTFRSAGPTVTKVPRCAVMTRERRQLPSGRAIELHRRPADRLATTICYSLN